MSCDFFISAIYRSKLLQSYFQAAGAQVLFMTKPHRLNSLK